MIHTVYSNAFEVLQTVLLHNLETLRLTETPPERSGGDVFFRRTLEHVPVLVPHRAAGRVLTRAIARRAGVCAGVDFMGASQWMNFFSYEPLANVVGNEADWMIWSILRETGPGSFREARGHERLRDYLKEKTDAEIFTLARRISGLFVRYVSYRLDWVMDWLGIAPEKEADRAAKKERTKLRDHPDFLWQRDLWRALAERPGWRGRAFLQKLPESLRALEAADPAKRRLALADGREIALPRELHVFMPFVVPPLMLPILKAYAKSGRDIWLYLWNPSEAYWFDLVPRRLFSVAERESGHREVGHPLLAANGRSTRANIDRLWRFTDQTVKVPELLPAEVETAGEIDAGRVEPIRPRRERFADFMSDAFVRPQDLTVDTVSDLQSYYLESNSPRLLRRIQDSVLTLDEGRVVPENGEILAPGDDSVAFAAAPTAAREAEALADWLLSAFAADPDLKPEDVLVATPDLAAALPLLERAFNALPDERRIAWRATGLQSVDPDSPAMALLDLARLLTGRCRSEDFLAWVALPAVSDALGLTINDVTILTQWLLEAGFRFGLSDAHLEAISPETFEEVRETTLERACERLLLGYLLPDDEKEPLLNVVPVTGTEGESWVSVADRPDLLDTLGRLCRDLEAFRLRTEEAVRGSASARVGWIVDAIDKFFPKSAAQDFSELKRGASELAREIETALGDDPERPAVAFDLFVQALEERLTKSPGSGTPGQGVTVTGMSDLRGIPHKVIAVVGLNEDSSFPGSSAHEEFDLMAAAPRRGDRDSRVDNRNVFLDLILCARERLLISYVAGTEAVERGPSVVAEELREWILGFEPESGARRRLAARLTHKIPLNAFSRAAFVPEAGPWRSHDAGLLETFRRASARGFEEREAPFADEGLPLVAEGGQRVVIALTDVVRWWRHPSKATLRAAGVSLSPEASDPTLGFFPSNDALDAWTVKNRMLEALLAGEDPQRIYLRLMRHPRFGSAGLREFRLGESLAGAQKIHEARERLRAGMEPAENRTIELEVSEGWVIAHEVKDLWKDPAGLCLLRCSVSKLSSLSWLMSWAEYALLAASGEKVASRWMTAEEKDEEKVHELPEITPGEARRFLNAFLLPFLETARSAAQLTDVGNAGGGYEPDRRFDRILWRGSPGEKSAEETRKALEGGFKKLWAPGKRDTFAKVLNAWIGALSRPGEDFSRLPPPQEFLAQGGDRA